MVAEHGDEIGIFGKVEHTFELEEGQQSPLALE